jgi:hypothetical protein
MSDLSCRKSVRPTDGRLLQRSGNDPRAFHLPLPETTPIGPTPRFLKARYQQLVAAGKPAKIAVTANALLKDVRLGLPALA